MEKSLEMLIEEARRLPLSQQLTLIERLVQSIHIEIEPGRALDQELAAWDKLSDEALANFEKAL